MLGLGFRVVSVLGFRLFNSLGFRVGPSRLPLLSRWGISPGQKNGNKQSVPDQPTNGRY